MSEKRRLWEDPFSFSPGKRAFLIGAGAAGATWLTSRVLDGSTEKRQELRTYRSGETIPNPALPVHIEGWKIHFDRSRTQRGDFVFQLVNDGMPKILFNFPPSLSRGGGTIYETVNNRGDDDRVFFRALPPQGANDLYLLYDDNAGRRTYRIELHSFTGTPNGRYENTFSETDIGQEKLDTLQAMGEAFDYFNDTSKVYITDYSNPAAYPELGIILISPDEFSHLHHPANGLSAVFHERTHMVKFSLANSPYNQAQNIRLENAFVQVAHVAGYANSTALAYEGGGYDSTHPNGPESSLFRVLTESSYINADGLYENDSSKGHPWNNANELFASTATLIRFFPDELLTQYQMLREDEQAAIREAIEATLDAFYAQAYREEDVTRLFPDSQKVARAIGYIPPPMPTYE